jgi:fructose-bisphosphate aldolase class I
MTMELQQTARALVADGRGILAADETPGTLTKRFAALDIESTPETRRAYRELFFTAPGVAEYISGVILQDETIRQYSAWGPPLPDLLAQQGILAGIKVDAGTRPLAGFPGEYVTGGVDGLRRRLAEYRAMGARFAKWRAVIAVTDRLPSAACVRVNAALLAHYAATCHEQGLVPIVEPEVLMEGTHNIERCEEVTGQVLHEVFAALFDRRVLLEGILLKPNMVIPGKRCATQASVVEVARMTMGCLRRHAPAAVPGIVFLSGGQDHLLATVHLSAINAVEGPKPWALTYSYGRALQDEALRIWRGRPELVRDAQEAFTHRARCDSAAVRGEYTTSMENYRAKAGR